MTDTEGDPELDHIGLSGTGLHEMVEAMNSVDPEYMRTGKPRIGDLPEFVGKMEIHDPEQDGTWDNWNNRTEAGELPLPRTELREYKPEPMISDELIGMVAPFTSEQMAGLSRDTKTPEEMASQLGCTVEELPDKIQGQIEYYMRAAQQIQNLFVPPKKNRAQRRAEEKMRRRKGR